MISEVIPIRVNLLRLSELYIRENEILAFFVSAFCKPVKPQTSLPKPSFFIIAKSHWELMNYQTNFGQQMGSLDTLSE